MPATAPVSPSLSSASDTAHESSRPSLAMTAATAATSVTGSFPIREAHGVAGAGLRSIARHVVHRMELLSGGVHRGDDRIPVLDLRGPDLERVLRQLRQ